MATMLNFCSFRYLSKHSPRVTSLNLHNTTVRYVLTLFILVEMRVLGLRKER